MRRRDRLTEAIRSVDVGDVASVEELGVSCGEFKEESIVCIRSAVEQAAGDYRKRMGLLEGLAECDLNNNVRFILRSLGDGDEHVSRVQQIFTKRMTCETRTQLLALLKEPDGIPPQYIMRALSLVIDDKATLAVALSLAEQDLPPEQKIEVILLLTHAAYYLDQPDLVKEIRPYFTNDIPNVRFFALTSLYMVPGQEAYELLESEIVRQGVSADTARDLREARRRVLAEKTRIASGWRSEG